MAVQSTVKLINKYGLHQRPAMKVIETASKFQSDIHLIRDGQRCNAKSIVEVIMLAAEFGTELQVEADGPDAQDAVEAMQALFVNKFYLEGEE